VSRFRSSHHYAARSLANFGIKGTLAIYDSSAVFGFEVPTRTRGYNDRNFKSTALAVTRRARLPSYRLQFQAPARGCDEKVTHGANVAARRDSRLAERAKQVTFPAPNHGRFLLH
jgi:hypothetical protein